ncbi:MAG: DUF2272 domain-containing protein [Candidatus Methylumidiphilus sp.]
MTDKFVDLEALNLRSTADTSTLSNRIGILHLGQSVQELGADLTTGWLKVQADIGGKTETGVVKAEINGQATLRDPVSPEHEALVAEAIKEWLRFAQGQGLEYQDPYYTYVGQMWKAIGMDLDGKDRETPWSAAAISFMVRHAGKIYSKYSNFKFAASHARYMHDSIVKRKAADASAPFWGFRLNERKPQIGDIAGKWRISRRDFDDAAAGDGFSSHSDIIVSVQTDHVLAIGGNVKQSVNITRYEKTGAGFLAATNKVFMLMVNQV